MQILLIDKFNKLFLRHPMLAKEPLVLFNLLFPYFFCLDAKKVGKKKSSHFAVLRSVYYLRSVTKRDSLPEGPGRRVTNC